MEYSPKQVNLLVGRNNSGKSTMISAIGTLFIKDVGLPESFDAPEFEINVDSNVASIISGERSFEIYRDIEFLPDNIAQIVKSELIKALKVTFKKIVNDNNETEIIDFLFSRFRFIVFIKNKQDVEFFPYPIDYRKTSREILSELKKYTKNEPERAEMRHLFFEFITIHFSIPTNQRKIPKIKINIVMHAEKVDISFRKNTKNVLEIENFLKEFNLIENLERLTENGIIYRKGSELQYLPYEYYGDGLKSLINILNSLMDVKNGILLIEEIENHLHPGYITIIIPIILQLSKTYKVQIFMTTHSIEVINEVLNYCKESEKNDNFLLISRFVSERNSIIKYDYSLKQALKICDKLGMDLRGI